MLRRVAAGGGSFKGENDLKVHIPGANLNDIANQADDLLEVLVETSSIYELLGFSFSCLILKVSCTLFSWLVVWC